MGECTNNIKIFGLKNSIKFAILERGFVFILSIMIVTVCLLCGIVGYLIGLITTA